MISAFLIQQERQRGRRVLRQRDGAPEVGDDLVSAGLRSSSAKTRSRGETVEICGRAAVAKLSQISPKTPLYIGGGGGRLSLGSKDSQGSRPSQGGRSPPPKPKSTWFGRWSPSSLSHLLLFFLFSLIFFLWRIGPSWAVPPAHQWLVRHPQGLWTSPGWVAASSEHPEPIRHSRYIPGNSENLPAIK